MWVYCLNYASCACRSHCVQSRDTQLQPRNNFAALHRSLTFSLQLKSKCQNCCTISGSSCDSDVRQNNDGAAFGFYVTAITRMKPKLENSHLSDYTQSQRDDLTRRTVTSVPTSSPCVFLTLWPGPVTLSTEPRRSLALTTSLFTGRHDLCGVTERNSPPTNPSSF